MYPTYTILCFYNDTASQQTMSAYTGAGQPAVLASSNANYLTYFWTCQNDTDNTTLQHVFGNSGAPGYPVAGCALPPPQA